MNLTQEKPLVKPNLKTKEQTYQAIIKADANNFNAFMELGRIYLDKEMWEESLYNFLRAEVLKPGPEVYLNIAELFFKKQNYKKAIEYYKKSMPSGKMVYEIEFKKGQAYEKIKEKKEGVRCYINAYNLKPQDSLCVKIASLALESKLFKESIYYYQIILKTQEKPLYYAEMGLAYMELGQYEESRKCYQRAKELSLAGKTIPPLKELTFDDFVARYPDIDENIKKVSKKIKEGSKNHQDHMDLGNMFFIKGEYQKSAEFYLKARENFLHQMVLKL